MTLPPQNCTVIKLPISLDYLNYSGHILLLPSDILIHLSCFLFASDILHKLRRIPQPNVINLNVLCNLFQSHQAPKNVSKLHNTKWPQFRDNVRTIDLLEDPIYFFLSSSRANLFIHNTVYITHSEEVRHFLLSETTMFCHHTWQTKYQINRKSIFVHALLLIKNVSMKVIWQKRDIGYIIYNRKHEWYKLEYSVTYLAYSYIFIGH